MRRSLLFCPETPRLMGSSMPKPRCGFCDGHHTPVDFDAASVAASRGVAIH
jgi:hypothetical protein